VHGQYAILSLLQVSLTAYNGVRSVSVICILTRSVCRPTSVVLLQTLAALCRLSKLKHRVLTLQ